MAKRFQRVHFFVLRRLSPGAAVGHGMNSVAIKFRTVPPGRRVKRRPCT